MSLCRNCILQKYSEYMKMTKPCGRKPFRWNNQFFKFPSYLPYKQTDVKVSRDNLEREYHSKCISRKQAMKVTINLKYGDIDSLGGNIEMPHQVKIVCVYVVKMVWTGRQFCKIEMCFCTAYNRQAHRGCWVKPGYFTY